MSESFQVVESEVQDQMLPELLLDFDSRKKCRFRATDSEGHVVEAFLPRGTVLTHGSVLVSDGNRRVRVVAKPGASFGGARRVSEEDDDVGHSRDDNEYRENNEYRERRLNT